MSGWRRSADEQRDTARIPDCHAAADNIRACCSKWSAQPDLRHKAGSGTRSGGHCLPWKSRTSLDYDRPGRVGARLPRGTPRTGSSIVAGGGGTDDDAQCRHHLRLVALYQRVPPGRGVKGARLRCQDLAIARALKHLATRSSCRPSATSNAAGTALAQRRRVRQLGRKSAMTQLGTGHPHLRTDPRFPQTPQRRKVRPGQPGGDRLAGPRLRVPAQGSPGGGVRPRRQLPGRLGHRRGQRPARAENRRRRRLHHRSLRLGREVVHAGRQAAAGTRPARRAFRHRLHRLPLARANARRGRSITPPR